MTMLRQGEIEGITWYEVENAGTNGQDVIVLTRHERVPTRQEVEDLTKKSWGLRLHAVPLSWFRPFDFDKVFPGQEILCREASFSDTLLTEWMKAHLDVPKDLDLRLQSGRHDLTLIARTMRGGLPVDVRRPLDVSIPTRDAVAKHFPYLMRHCRKPIDVAGYRCRSHLNAVVERITDLASAELSEWLKRHDDLKPHSQSPRGLWFHGALVRAKGVLDLKLEMERRTGAIRSTIRLEGGHEIEEDDKGLEVRLAVTLPDSVRTTLVGRPLSDVLDAPWASDIRIKTVRDGSPTSLRAGCTGDSFILPEGRPIDDEEAIPLLDRLGMPTQKGFTQISTVTSGAMPAFEGLDAGTIATILAQLPIPSTLDLRPFGRPGWILRNQGGDIIVEKSPGVPFATAVATLTAKATNTG